jgi:hypothetical protein
MRTREKERALAAHRRMLALHLDQYRSARRRLALAGVRGESGDDSDRRDIALQAVGIAEELDQLGGPP